MTDEAEISVVSTLDKFGINEYIKNYKFKNNLDIFNIINCSRFVCKIFTIFFNLSDTFKLT